MNIAETLAIEQRLIKIFGPNYTEKDIPPTYRQTVGRCHCCGKLTDERGRFADSPKDETGYLDWLCEGCKEN